ncbi:uncharacterized protein LOC144135493 [Amblyomma americanum]
MTAIRVAILGLLLAGCVSEALHKDLKSYMNESNKGTEPENRSPSRQRACLLADGPQNAKDCEAFVKRWVNKTEEENRKMNPKVDHEAFGNMSKKDVLVTIGCYAMYTFAQQMWDTCVDANLLTDLLLCQYDNLEDKEIFLKEFHNVKERQDLIDFMEDLKKCAGTVEGPIDSMVEQPGGPMPNKIEIMEIFIRPMKKMRSYIESKLVDSQE